MRRVLVALLLIALLLLALALLAPGERRGGERTATAVAPTTATEPRSARPAPIVSHPYTRVVCTDATCATTPPGFGEPPPPPTPQGS